MTSTHDRVVHAIGGTTMGTTWSVKLVGAPRADLRAWHRCASDALDRVVAQMSNWDPDSHLSRFNRAQVGEMHALPTELRTVLSRALAIAQASDGAFDPTVGPAVDAWGFGPPGPAAALPDAAAIANARARIGWRRLHLHDDGRLRQPGGVRLDLCAIAKGFAVDHVAAALRAAGVGAALVEVGGELAGHGRKPDGTPWRVVVEGWDGDVDDATPPCVIALDGLAVATSGDRWHGRDDGERRHGHTLDPRSGIALHDAPRAVTVLAGTAMDADAWATALTVLGDERGFALACDHDLAARFIGSRADAHRERTTPRFDALRAG